MKSGILYYPSGAVYFAGRYEEIRPAEGGISYRLYAGTEFYGDGTPYREGLFQRSGLYYGRIFYPSGTVKFIGRFNDKHGEMTGCKPEDYYGPSYPVEGTFYGEDGSVLYCGTFKTVKQGSVGYPKVVIPENFGPLK